MQLRFAMSVLILVCLLGGCAPGPSDVDQGLENGSFTAELNGFNIHYEVRGEGPVLMVVPNSWGLTHQGLRGLLQPLEEHLTLVYFDPRGMGGSDAVREDSDMSMATVRADFDALRRHLGLEQVHAIGWSNGAANLILLAAEYPETLSSAIFLHGVAGFSPQDAQKMVARYPELFERYATFQREMQSEDITPEERDGRTKAFNLKVSFPYMFADPEAGRRLLPAIFGDAEFSWEHAQYANAESSTFDARDRLAAIEARSLVVAGARDMMPPEKVEEIHAGIADSEFVVFENSGHFAPVEEPEAFVAAVLDFLGEGSPGS